MAVQETEIGKWIAEHFNVRKWDEPVRIYCRLCREPRSVAFIYIARRQWLCNWCERKGTLEDLALKLGIPAPPAAGGGV